MKVNLTIKYAGQEVMFKNLELDEQDLGTYASPYEKLIDDFMCYWQCEAVNAKTGEELEG